MGIQKSVFWDDLEHDLESPARLEAFIKESIRIQELDALANRSSNATKKAFLLKIANQTFRVRNG